MKISDILTEDNVSLDLGASDKNDAINKIVELAYNSGRILDLPKVKECVFDREKLVSTGVGKNFAVPHGKSEEITDVVVAFAINKPIDFDSIDQEPVRFIFLIVGKDTMMNIHIKLLSRVSRLINKDEFRANLLKAKDKKAILKLFVDEEQQYLDI